MEQLLEMDIHGNIEHYIYSHLEGLGHIQKTKKNAVHESSTKGRTIYILQLLIVSILFRNLKG